MTKTSIALVTGGDVAERGISLLSAQTIYDHLDKTKYAPRIIDYKDGEFKDVDSGKYLSKVDFSLDLGEKLRFDLVYPILHGHPAENGVLQGYLEMIGQPYAGSGQLSSALSFNKQACKTFIQSLDIPMAASMVLKKEEPINMHKIAKLGLPLFIKPNQNGSSYGISKATLLEAVKPAIENAFKYDTEIIIEAFLDGPEYSGGVFRKGEEIVMLPITEIIPDQEREFFDFEAKYENKSKEITPARISEQLASICKEQTKTIYQALDCKGICRADYILGEGKFYFLEINTIPGFSGNSLVPQQARAMDLPISDMLDAVVEEALGKKVAV